MDGNSCGTDAIRQEVVRLAGERMIQAAIAGQLKIGEAIVYRILAAAQSKNPDPRFSSGGGYPQVHAVNPVTSHFRTRELSVRAV